MRKITFIIFIMIQLMIANETYAKWYMGGSIRTSSCETLTNIYCFTTDGFNLYVGANNVKCSTNNGIQWINAGIMGFGSDFSTVKDLKYHDNRIYAATSKGVYVANSPLQGWVALNYGLLFKWTGAMIFSNNTLYVATNNGIFKSTNLGKFWTKTGNDSLLSYTNSLAYYKDILFAGNVRGLFKSTNNGNNWENIKIETTNESISSILVLKNYIFVGVRKKGIYRTDDEGKTWTKLSALHTGENRFFSLLSFGNVIFSGTEDGIYMSKDYGNSWECINQNLELKDLYQVEMIVKDNFLIAGITPFSYRTVYMDISQLDIHLDLTIVGYSMSCINNLASFSTKMEKDVTIRWSVENGEIIGSDSDSVVRVRWNSIGTGKITLIKENKILNIKDSSYKLVEVVDVPSKPIITVKDKKLISSSPYGNQWYVNGYIIRDATGRELIPKWNGTYTVEVYFNDCLSAMSDSVNFMVTGIANEYKNTESTISPNPATDYIEITVDNHALQGVDGVGTDRPLKYAVQVYDVLGVVVLKSTTPSLRDTPPYQGGQSIRIDVSALPAGVYFVRVGVKMYKFVKM